MNLKWNQRNLDPFDASSKISEQPQMTNNLLSVSARWHKAAKDHSGKSLDASWDNAEVPHRSCSRTVQVGGPQISCRVLVSPGACTPGRKERHRQHGRTKCGKKKGILGGFLLEKKTERVYSQNALIGDSFWRAFRKKSTACFSGVVQIQKGALYRSRTECCSLLPVMLRVGHQMPLGHRHVWNNSIVPAAWWFRLRNCSLFFTTHSWVYQAIHKISHAATPKW